jgi:DNA-binding NarL/FixJ family response regulator
MPRVLICDDALAFSVLFKHWMRKCELEVIGPAGTAEDAVAIAERQQPDVVVVDHLLPDATSAELVPRLRDAAPDAGVLLISSLLEPDLARAADEAGADGYVTKASGEHELRDAVMSLIAAQSATR